MSIRQPYSPFRDLGSSDNIMTKQRIYRSTYPAPYCPKNISISEFLTRYNPDAVPEDKVIIEDDWTGHSLTYGDLRKIAGQHAWALRERYNLSAGDVVAISAPNSVCVRQTRNILVVRG